MINPQNQPSPLTEPNPASHPTPLLAPVLKHGRKDPSKRRITFCEPRELQPLGEALGRAWATEPRPDVLVWCGNQPGRRMVRADVEDAERCGWSVSSYRSELRSATFTRDGARLDVRSSVPWFGGVSDADLIERAWHDLGAVLRDEKRGFGSWAYLWPTPTLTGQELLRGTLPKGHEYRMAPVDILETLLRVLPAGRSELFTAPGALNGGRGLLGAVSNLDMRWSYAACLHGLPVGRVEHERYARPKKMSIGDVGYEPSFYKVRVRIPVDWDHIGLLPLKVRATSQPVTTTYPSEPGREFVSWASGAEIQVALLRGWHLWMQRSIRWPETGRHNLAREWIETLRALRSRATYAASSDPRRYPTAALVAAALRNLVIHTVGSWNRVARRDEGYATYGQGPLAIPAGAIPFPVDGGWQWQRAVEQLDEWSHPEWFHTVVGRVRAKAAKKALTLPVGSLVSIRTDGILTTAEPDCSGDTGDPGSWRVKWTLPYQQPAPRSMAGVLQLIRTGAGEHDPEAESEDSEGDDDGQTR